jgi:hypothetical protein
MTDADAGLILAELHRLARRIDLLTERLPAAPTPRLAASDAAILTTLLPAIVVAAGDRVFTAGELVAHSLLPTAKTLQDALAPVGGTRALGKLLRRSCGVLVAGCVVERVGADRGGAIWCVRVSAPVTPTETRSSDGARSQARR